MNQTLKALPLHDSFWITKRRAGMALQSCFLGLNPLLASQVGEQNRTLSSYLLLAVLTPYLGTCITLPTCPKQTHTGKYGLYAK
jgi:hypothetical protein